MLLTKIQEDLKQSMLSKDEVKTSTLRMLISEVKYAAISNRDIAIAKESEDENQQLGDNLPDDIVLNVIQKEAKKRKEAAEGFRKGGREEQAQKEDSELKVLESYLPAQLPDEELQKIVEEVINNLSASVQDMGRVIGAVREKVGSSADGGRISQFVKAQLQPTNYELKTIN